MIPCTVCTTTEGTNERSLVEDAIRGEVVKMKRRVFFWATAFAAVLAIAPSMACARPVQEVVITATGQSEIKDLAELCRTFKPTVRQVERYFARSYHVDGRWSDKVFYSPCYAEGTVKFKDGNSGKWILTSGGVAEITWDANGRVVLYHDHKRNGWFDPYADMYDEPGV